MPAFLPFPTVFFKLQIKAFADDKAKVTQKLKFDFR